MDAAAAFWVLGQQARPAIPELAYLLDGTNYSARELALSSITALGPDALPTLLDLVTNRPAHRRFPTLRLVQAFEQLGPNGSSAVPVLIDHLKDPNPQVGEASAFLLAAIGTNAPAPDAVVTALSANSETTNALVRSSAVTALMGFGEYARPAVPMLLKALNDPVPDVKRAARDALAIIAPELTIPQRPPPKVTPSL
jgi:HEAT repeat protein